MRTSFDVPDPLFRHLKARAAMEGTSLRTLMLGLIEKGLNPVATTAAAQSPALLPSVSLGAPMAMAAGELSNASLAALLDE